PNIITLALYYDNLHPHFPSQTPTIFPGEKPLIFILQVVLPISEDVIDFKPRFHNTKEDLGRGVPSESDLHGSDQKNNSSGAKMTRHLRKNCSHQRLCKYTLFAYDAFLLDCPVVLLFFKSYVEVRYWRKLPSFVDAYLCLVVNEFYRKYGYDGMRSEILLSEASGCLKVSDFGLIILPQQPKPPTLFSFLSLLPLFPSLSTSLPSTTDHSPHPQPKPPPFSHPYHHYLRFSSLITRPKKLTKIERAVSTALWCNFLVFSLKFGVWIATSSHVMLAEVVHSFADLANRIYLNLVK
ncbi:hypothetical protein M8C21_032200, partial [Ambrosia artemisiifolia]